MTIGIVLIEDEDLVDLPDRIGAIGPGQFEVTALMPPSNLDLHGILEVDADLFLVDYELDTSQPGRDVVAYRGVTLAASLREKRPEIPIALLTRSSLPTWMAARRTAQAGAMYDDVLYKDIDLRDDQSAVYSRLVSLANGYSTIRASSDRTLPALLQLLGTDETGQEMALEALPPEDGWKGFEAAHWIRSVLLNYPGVLYDDSHAATALGVSRSALDIETLYQLLKPALYRGPFYEKGQHWWRHALFDLANELCTRNDIELGIRDGFRVGVKKELGLDLEPSQDIETGRSPADTVCHLLKVPVRIETSLPYHPDSRPPVMERARVSFKAIRESNDVEEMHIDSGSRNRINEIRRIV